MSERLPGEQQRREQERGQDREKPRETGRDAARHRLAWLGLAAAVILVLAALLTLLAGETVRERLIRPLLVFIQLVKIYVTALPQVVVWFFVLLGLIALGGYLLRDLLRLRRAAARESARRLRAEERLPRLDTITALATRIRLGQEGEYFRWRIRRELQDFLIKLLSWRKKISSDEAQVLVRSGAWTGDDKVREFLGRGFTRSGRLRDALLNLFRVHWKRHDERFLRELTYVIDYLERYAQGGDREAQ